MSDEVSILLQPDGTVLVPRGTKEQNNIVRGLVSDLAGVSQEQIESFLSMTDDGELLFGESTHCG